MSRAYPRYPAYKDSGVEWLGEVPEGWKLTALKHGYTVSLGKMLQPEPKTETDQLLPYLRAANIQPKDIDLTDIKEMWFSEQEVLQLELTHGDLLVSEGGDVGRCAIWKHEGKFYYQNSINRVREAKGNSNRFLYFWLGSLKDSGFIDVVCNKSTISHLTAEKLQSLPILLPSAIEQQQVSTFLDRETSRLDSLISEQRRLIDLLREKRSALISHAVTKGLDPNVPMKDSGVEWLGEVPEHWDVTTVRRISVTVQTGRTPSEVSLEDQLEDGIMWFTPSDFNGSLFLTSSAKKISKKTIECGDANIFAAGSVLIVSIGATLGKVGLSRFPSSANQQINAVTPNSRADAHFLAYSLSAKEGMMRFLSNSSTIGIMNQEKTKEIWLVLPPPEEQFAIAAYLDQQTSRLDTLISEAERSISLLQERRSALITAAVTGKIDLRGWVEA